MKENKNIEELLKDHLNQEFEFNDSDLDELSSILDDYNKEPGRKKGAFFIAAGILLLLGMMLSLFFNKSKINNDNLIVENAEIIENNSNKNIKDPKYKINNSKESESDCIVVENEFTQNNKTESISTKQAVTTKIVLKQNNVNKIRNSIIKSKTENQKTTSKQKNIIQKNNLKNNAISLQVTNKLNNVLGNKKEAKEKNIINYKNDPIMVEDKISEEIKIESFTTEITFENKAISSEKLSNINHNENLNIENIEKKSVVKINNKIDTIIENQDNIVNTLPEKQKIGISIMLKAGPSFLNRQFNSDNIKRNTEESNITTWNTSLELSKTIKNKFLLVTGLNLINYGENIDYTPIDYIKLDTTYSLETNTYGLYTYSKANGVFKIDTTSIELVDTVFVVNEQMLKDKSVSKENGQTKFSYIEIPFLVGYKFLNKNKFSLSGMTGASIGLLTNSKGFYIDNENVLQKAESNKIIFNYLLSLEFKYNVFNNIHISLSPHFKQNLNNLSKLNEIERKYSTFGINAGIGIDF